MKNNLENALVVKHNDLIEARYDLNLIEQKIILYSVTNIDKSKEKFNLIRLKVQEMADLMESNKIRYSEFRKITNGLMDRKVYLKDRPNLDVRWLASSEYIGDGMIELEFSEKLIPYLLQLKARFTRYKLKNIINFKNKHSLRIYELLKQYETIRERKFDIKELKELLMIEDQYPRIYDLERFVLKITSKEINKYTDINIDYEKIKTGRKVTSIKFTIQPKVKEEIIINDIEELKIKMGLKGEKFSGRQIMDIYELAIEKTQDQVDVYEYVRLNYLHIKDKARNRYSYLMKAIENDYAVAAAQINLDYYV